jgi:hypothetical protein
VVNPDPDPHGSVLVGCIRIKAGKTKNYLFFYMALGLNDFDAGKSFTRAPENRDFFGP